MFISKRIGSPIYNGRLPESGRSPHPFRDLSSAFCGAFRDKKRSRKGPSLVRKKASEMSRKLDVLAPLAGPLCPLAMGLVDIEWLASDALPDHHFAAATGTRVDLAIWRPVAVGPVFYPMFEEWPLPFVVFAICGISIVSISS